MKIEYIDLSRLILDSSNPRFAELYGGSTKEQDLVEYLLYTESGEEIAKAISISREFYPDRALWVIKDGKNFLVKDGNRRCAAVKALASPLKYKLELSKFILNTLPVIVYTDKEELERRILEEHTASLFKEWDRIAKALEVYRRHKTGSSVDALKEVDSNPSELIKLASFYYSAVEIGGDDFKKLLRRGRKEGGKTIIFERLFKHKELCGYKFQNKPSYEIEITDEVRFTSYIAALVGYLKQNPDTTHTDAEKSDFLNNLEEFGFSKSFIAKENKESESEKDTTEELRKAKRGSTKRKPTLERKQIPSNLRRLIEECYQLDAEHFPNAKLALTRVVFECVLKYVLEETKFNSKAKFIDSVFFRDALFDRNGNKKPFTDFDKLKTKFIELILNTGKRKAFQNFDLEKPHQIIHNYNVGGVPADANSMCDNLMPLLEFMLQSEPDLLKALDLTKL